MELNSNLVNFLKSDSSYKEWVLLYEGVSKSFQTESKTK
jgi:hypothetical protein